MPHELYLFLWARILCYGCALRFISLPLTNLWANLILHVQLHYPAKSDPIFILLVYIQSIQIVCNVCIWYIIVYETIPNYYTVHTLIKYLYLYMLGIWNSCSHLWQCNSLNRKVYEILIGIKIDKSSVKIVE